MVKGTGASSSRLSAALRRGRSLRGRKTRARSGALDSLLRGPARMRAAVRCLMLSGSSFKIWATPRRKISDLR